MASLISDNDIKRLEKVRDILKEIKELNLDFGISNIIETESNTTLVFKCNGLLKKEDLEKEEIKLVDKLRLDCLLLPCNIELDKAIKRKRVMLDCETMTIFDNDKLVKSITRQYK